MPEPLAEVAKSASPEPEAEREHVVALALQGGGAHGAFTWGVLDVLLQQPDIRVAAVSGTSAGAMNAVLLAHGLTSGGVPRARQLLEDFWRAIADAGRLSPFRRSWLDRLDGGWSLDRSPWLALMDVARQFLSPYQTNPLGLNPLREVLERHVDFDALRRQRRVAVHVAATNVETGQARIFSTREISAESVLASACLPFLFQAVEIDNVPHWDGGYACNPPLLPLLHGNEAKHLLVVPVNPPERKGTPRNARDILNRMNEIVFNASLTHGLESLARINALIDQGEIGEDTYRRLNLHVIGADAEFRALTASSKFNTEWDFLVYLRDLGRRTAENWLAEQPWEKSIPPAR
ncbi:MAG: patatin-like phospholipase family protein [Magnetospirillum gryphiswaldense]|nr:patatin-like phospholipase family protein [Magnetospirillum gryphiswaldense]